MGEEKPDSPRTSGDLETVDRLFVQVYDEMRRVAMACLSGERASHTLQPTALVHEAYLRIRGQRSMHVTRDVEFLRVAAKVMRRILIDHARGRLALKRGEGRPPDRGLENLVAVENDHFEVLPLDEALGELAKHDAAKAQLVELRAFAGLTISELAVALDMPRRTVEREWAFCRAWLRRRVARAPEG